MMALVAGALKVGKNSEVREDVIAREERRLEKHKAEKARTESALLLIMTLAS